MLYGKTAFTMIELIFVIVILGILAAVAIPKLVVTRDDAYTAKLANNIMTGASEIAAYAMGNAQVHSDMTVMSNAMTSLSASGDAVLTPNKAVVKSGNIDDCVEVSVDANATTGTDTLNITFGNAGGDSKCLSLQGAIDANEYPMKLRGRSAKF
jgi:prepilin-type N-terminal cleavage/methylation domain-containing protein